MSFLAPLGLLFVLAVAIPIIIHLLDPDKGKHIYLGSLQFLQNVKQTQQPNYRIQQWLLLALRCLMIVLMALLIAQWLLPSGAMHKNVVVVPNDWPQNFSEAQQAQYQMLTEQGAEVVKTGPGFSALAEGLSALNRSRDQHVFVANSADNFPLQLLPQQDNRHWYIAPVSANDNAVQSWLIVFSTEARNLAQRIENQLQKIPNLQLQVRTVDALTAETSTYDAIIQLSSEVSLESMSQRLKDKGALLAPALNSEQTVPPAQFSADGSPVTRQYLVNEISHTVFNPQLLHELHHWVEQPWFSASVTAMLQAQQSRGAVAADMLEQQLQSKAQILKVKQTAPLVLLFILLIIWYLERMLSAKVAKEGRPE